MPSEFDLEISVLQKGEKLGYMNYHTFTRKLCSMAKINPSVSDALHTQHCLGLG